MSKNIFIKLKSYLSIVLVAVLLSSCGEQLTYTEPNDDDLSLRTLVNKYYKNSGFYLGALPGANYFTDLNKVNWKNLYYKEFAMSTLQTEFNQSVVYPLPNKEWFDGGYKSQFDLARKNEQILSVDASLSENCSDWIKDETSALHTSANILNVLNFYQANISKELEKNKDVVKWMSVVKNPVSTGHEGLNYDGTGVTQTYQAGEWFGPVSGVGFENPWTVLGFTDTILTNVQLNENRIPKYIFDAFRISNQNAPGVKQIITQLDGELNEKVWNTLKQLLITLRQNGVRVDGIGWIARLDLNKGFGQENLRRLSLLIDWCYQNNFEFHVIGLEVKSSDVNRWDTEDLDGIAKKETEIAAVFSSVADIVIQKAGKGAKSLGYGILDGRYESGIGTYANLFNHDGEKGLMYSELQNLLIPDLSNK